MSSVAQSRPLASLRRAIPVEEAQGIQPTMDAQFGVDGDGMRLDRSSPNAEFVSDLPVCQTASQPVQNLGLTRR